MLDRGLRRRFDPLVDREARAAAERAPLDVAAHRPARAADVHDRPADGARLRRRDQRRAARDGGVIRVWVHIADVSAYVRPGSAVDREAYRRATSVYVPGKVEPMLPEALSNEACSLVPHQDRLAVTVELDFKRRRGGPQRVPPLADPLRRAPGLPAGGPRARRHASGRRSRGRGPLAVARGVAAALAAKREARGAIAVESVEPEFDFSHEGHVTALHAVGADGVAPPDRAPHDRRQRGGGGAAGGAQAAGALPRARAPGPAAGRAPGRAARGAGRADAAAARHDDAAAGRRPGRRGLAAGRRARAAHRPRPRGAHIARAALAQAGALHPAQRGALRPALAALLPLHVADPALPRPDLPPRAARRDRRGRGPAGRRRRSRARASGARRASATRRRSSARPTTSRAASCSRQSCSGAAGSASGRAR